MCPAVPSSGQCRTSHVNPIDVPLVQQLDRWSNRYVSMRDRLKAVRHLNPTCAAIFQLEGIAKD